MKAIINNKNYKHCIINIILYNRNYNIKLLTNFFCR